MIEQTRISRIQQRILSAAAPVKGDRVAVKYGTDEWYLGTVNRSGAKVTVAFDDESTESFVWPNAKIKLVSYKRVRKTALTDTAVQAILVKESTTAPAKSAKTPAPTKAPTTGKLRLMAGIPSSIVSKGARVIEISSDRDIAQKKPETDICIIKIGGNLGIAVNAYGVRWSIHESADLVVMDGPLLVGILLGSLNSTLFRYKVEYVHVDKNYQKKGIGGMMAEAVVKNLVSEHAKRISLGKSVKSIQLTTAGTTVPGNKWMLYLKSIVAKALPSVLVSLKFG